MGFSVDWSHEYITMLPEYYKKTQLSFLRMLSAGYIYQSEHPVNFCTRCETAIAFAEVAYEPRETTLNYFDFDGVDVATTRPELLAACVAVAVHPDDERYRNMAGRNLTVPLFGHRVPLITDPAVDPSFGSGAVMICTFGDKQDVHWWKQHKLELRKAIDRQGRMTAIAGKYAGMKSADCRKAILEDMKEQQILTRQEPLEQRVGACWRCKTPIEIMSERQWFVKIDPEAIMKAAREIEWIPDHMFLRIENWVQQMEWDWCISRQRVFATPSGLVLQGMRGDGRPRRGGTPGRSNRPSAVQALPAVRIWGLFRRRGCPRYMDGLLYLRPECHGMGRKRRPTALPGGITPPGPRHHTDMGILHDTPVCRTHWAASLGYDTRQRDGPWGRRVQDE